MIVAVNYARERAFYVLFWHTCSLDGKVLWQRVLQEVRAAAEADRRQRLLAAAAAAVKQSAPPVSARTAKPQRAPKAAALLQQKDAAAAAAAAAAAQCQESPRSDADAAADHCGALHRQGVPSGLPTTLPLSSYAFYRLVCPCLETATLYLE